MDYEENEHVLKWVLTVANAEECLAFYAQYDKFIIIDAFMFKWPILYSFYYNCR